MAPVVPLPPGSTSRQVAPPSVVRYRPRTPPGTNRLPAAAAKIRLGLVGSMASRPVRSLPASPAGAQVVPPSVDRNTPLPGNVTPPPPGLPSPVPAYRVPLGVIARAPIDGVTVVGHALLKVRPASVLRHTPPVAAPAYTVSGRTGSTTRSVTRPPMLAGPSGCHAGAARLAARGATAARTAWSCAARYAASRATGDWYGYRRWSANHWSLPAGPAPGPSSSSMATLSRSPDSAVEPGSPAVLAARISASPNRGNRARRVMPPLDRYPPMRTRRLSSRPSTFPGSDP